MLFKMSAPQFLFVTILNSVLIRLNLSCAQQFYFKYSTLKVFLKSTKFKLVLIEFQLSKISVGLGEKWQMHLLSLGGKGVFLYIPVFLFLTPPMELPCTLKFNFRIAGQGRTCST